MGLKTVLRNSPRANVSKSTSSLPAHRCNLLLAPAAVHRVEEFSAPSTHMTIIGWATHTIVGEMQNIALVYND